VAWRPTMECMVTSNMTSSAVVEPGRLFCKWGVHGYAFVPAPTKKQVKKEKKREIVQCKVQCVKRRQL
jgi:hypothetical protein